MKIISKFKDYYDYLAHSKYGVDNHIVLDRRNGYSFPDFKIHFTPTKLHFEKYVVIKVAICGDLYCGLVDKDAKVIWTNLENHSSKSTNPFTGEDIYTVNDDGCWSKRININPIKTDINDKRNCPIVFISDLNEKIDYPQLKAVNFSQIMSPDEIYIKIYNWMLERKNKDIIDSRSNDQKIESFGFDIKKSFRHR